MLSALSFSCIKEVKLNYKELAQQFRELLEAYKKVTIISHIRPDGDTIGSATALFNSLKLMGYQVELVCRDSDLPLKLNFLDGFKRYKKKIDYNDSLVVTLDCADISRAGFDLQDRSIVNIDHHKSNTNFGVLNIVEVEVSTTVVLYKLLKEGFAIEKKVAEALYAGLLTDSINFTTTLVNSQTFELASELLGYGLNVSYISEMINKRNSLAHTRLIARAIENLELFNNAKIAVMVLESKDLKATGAKGSDLNGIIDFAIALVTVEVAVLIVELDNILKVSIRSKNEDISTVATKFGGGGHKNAGGFEVKSGKIDELKSKILEQIKDNINE